MSREAKLKTALLMLIEQHCSNGAQPHPYNICIDGEWFHDSGLCSDEYAFDTLRELYPEEFEWKLES